MSTRPSPRASHQARRSPKYTPLVQKGQRPPSTSGQAGALVYFNTEASWASALRHFTHDEVRDPLRANQYFIQKHTPENIEIMKGMAAGATAAGFDLSYEDALITKSTTTCSARWPVR
jgi:hypothetical protein